MFHRTCLLMLIVAHPGGPAWAQASAPTQSLEPSAVEEATTSEYPPSEQTESVDDLVDDLVGALGSADFDRREVATRRLVELGSKAYEVLAREYGASDDYEVRLRIQEIVTRAFFRENLFGRNGFLGIGLDVLGHAIDFRVPKGHSGVEVRTLVEGTSADRGGLKIGDLIIAVNGELLPSDLNREDFSGTIRDAGPGASMRLSVHRGQQLRSLDIVLGARPLKYYNEPEHLRMLEETSHRFNRWWIEQFAPGSGSPPHRP
jgi:C-terminal processing protease CtpA/Prc